MEEIIYYLRDDITDDRKTTVCLLTDGDKVARGVAICNTGEKHKDQFDRKRGLAIARGRAAKAMVMEETCPKNTIEREFPYYTVPPSFISKCQFMPKLTKFEEELSIPF